MKLFSLLVLTLMVSVSMFTAYGQGSDELKTSMVPIVETSEKIVLVNFDFMTTDLQEIQEHVDYTLTVSKNAVVIFGPTPMSHSSTGKVSLPISVNNFQQYDVLIEVHGILFRSIPVETSSFSISPGMGDIQSQFTTKKGLKINLAVNKDPSISEKVIPDWIKNNAVWWVDGKINDETFVQGIQYLIKEKIIDIPKLPYPSSWMDKNVPSWVKNNASWWAGDLIHEDEFIKGIKYLVEKGLIQV